MSDARGQLSDLREALFQSKLLFHFDDWRQVSEQANGPVWLPLAVRKRRYADAQIRRRLVGRAYLQRSADDWLPLVQTLVDQLRQCSRQNCSILFSKRRAVAVQQAASSGVQDAKVPIARDNEQTRRQALDDFAAEPLGGFGARRHFALLYFELCERFVQGSGNERRLAAVLAQVPA